MTKSESAVLRILSIIFSFVGILYYGFILIQSLKYHFHEITILPNGGFDLKPIFSTEKFIGSIPYFINLILLLSLTVFTILSFLKQKKSYDIIFIANTIILILSMFFIDTVLPEFMFIRYNLPRFLYKFLSSLPNNTFTYLKAVPFAASVFFTIPLLPIKNSFSSLRSGQN